MCILDAFMHGQGGDDSTLLAYIAAVTFKYIVSLGSMSVLGSMGCFAVGAWDAWDGEIKYYCSLGVHHAHMHACKPTVKMIDSASTHAHQHYLIIRV